MPAGAVFKTYSRLVILAAFVTTVSAGCDTVSETRTPIATKKPSRAYVRHASYSQKITMGKTYRATVTDTMNREAVVRLNGKPVHIRGAQKGDEVTFIVTDDLGDHAVAYLVSRRGKESTDLGASQDILQTGAIYTVTVSDPYEHNHGAGVAWVAGYPIVISDARPGERLRVRIKERSLHEARAEVLEHINGE